MTQPRRIIRRTTSALLASLATIALAVTITPTAAAVPKPVGEQVVTKALPGVPVRQVTGKVPLLNGSATLTAPADRETYATGDALIAVLERGQSNATFGLPGYAEVQPDGTVIAGTGVQGLSVEIAKPWARDADGKSLPTRYEVDGTNLIQHVDTAGAAFPIAADPRLTFGAGVYLNITGAEMKALTIAVISAGGVGAVAVCAGLTKLPTAISKIAKVACTVVGAPTLAGIYNSIISVWRSGKIKTTWCYQKRIVGPSTGWYDVPMRNCTG